MVERQVANHLQNYKASGAELILGKGLLPVKSEKQHVPSFLKNSAGWTALPATHETKEN